MNILAFVEGETEKRVLQAIRPMMSGLTLTVPDPQGKDKLNSNMSDALAGMFTQKGLKYPVRFLVLRDLDVHTVENIVQGVRDAVHRTLQEQMPGAPPLTLSQLQGFPSVYTLALSQPDFRLALHIATYRWSEEFVKATIDDYVLSLAVQPTTADALVAKKGWKISAEDLLRKVTTEIPGLLEGNGIPLREAKDYVRLYAAVIQEHTSPPVFAQRTLAHASEGDLRRVFAPLLAAIEFLRS